MCGIAGILKVHPPGTTPPPHDVSIPEVWLDILDDSIKHRGPDGQGRFRDRAVRPDGTVVDVALVHRRLAVIDHACGAQPMVSARGRGDGEGLVAVVFNGCIYNHRALRKELQAAGRTFETDHSDTEALIHAWREWGVEFPAHLDGMFATAIWDHRRGQLVLARDFAGEKPLYIMAPDSGPVSIVGFASTAAALMMLMRLMGAPVELGNVGLAPWVRNGWECDPPIRMLRQVRPRGWRFNHAWEGAEIMTERRRSLPKRGAIAALDADRLDAILSAAVASRLEADVPIGCFLSGGVDSSLVTKYALDSGRTIRTFCVRMPDARFDESPHASAVARRLGTEHQTLDVSCNPAEDLVSLIEEVGVPLGDSSLLPTYWVSRAARECITVAVGGDGGDELFGGYTRYRAQGALRKYRWLLRAAAGVIPESLRSQSDPSTKESRLGRLLQAAAGCGYPDLLAIFPSDPMARLVAEDGDPDALRSGPGYFRNPDPLRWDFEHYLPDDLLRKTDTASMSVALELRSPLLAISVVNAALCEPLWSLMPRGQRKGLLRQVARKYLPAEIVDRPKQGFAIPIGEWFRTDYGGMKTVLLDHLNSAEPWGSPSLGIDLNMKFVRQMLDEHLGTGMSGRVKRDHSQRLYMLLVLSIWAKWLGSLSKP